MNRARMLLTLCIVIAAGMASPTFAFSQDDAVVVCQNKKKKQKIKLRPDGCTSKEDLVLDLTDVLTGDGTTESRITVTENRITVIERYLGVVCEGDPSRTVFAGRSGTGACEQFNGDGPGCESAFESLDLGEGSVSCFFDNDEECAGCGPSQESLGFCTNSCTSQ